MNKQIETLLSLSELDAEILKHTTRRKELETRLDAFHAELEDRRNRLNEVEAAHEEGTLKQVVAEHRLRDEQEKIVDRRKKLTTLGGMKSAKLVEREIDIASKTLTMMESSAMEALEEVDTLNEELSALRDSLNTLSEQYESERAEADKEIETIIGEVEKLSGDRKKLIGKIEDRLLRIYDRIKGRYPGDALATAVDGACQSCFRALPAQTYNQVIAGNLFIQCPGCSRIIVYGGGAVEN